MSGRSRSENTESESRIWGSFQGLHTRKQLRRLVRGSDGESSSENRAIPQRTFAYYTVLHAASLSYNRLTAARTGLSPATAARVAKQTRTATGMHDDVGAGLDIRVDAHAERGDGDAHSRGVESVARRCTGREPMSMASTAAATVTVELVSGGAARGSDTHSTVAVGGGADVPDIPEIVSEQSGAAMP